MWVVSTVCALAALGAGAGTEVTPGTPIVAVRIERHDIYDLDDPATSAWPYRWVDALHILTREEFIRSLLLFHVGDPLDPARLTESELILRGTGFLNPVHISARLVRGGAEVVVETHDQWTTGVGIDFGVSGNRRHSGGSISEDNLFGLGKSVLLEVRSDPERTSTAFRYRDLTFLRSRWQLGLGHKKSSDGSTDFFQLEYPFFAILTPRAGGVEWHREGLQEYLWSGGHRNVAGQADTRSFAVWGGVRLPGDGILTNRLTFGVFGERASFHDWRRLDGSPYPQPQDRDLLGVEVGWEHQTLNWRVVQGFRAWLRQEDLPLGPNWQVTTGLSLPALGGDRTRLRYHGSLTVGQLNGRTYSWLIADLSGRVEDGGLANGVTHIEVGGALTGTAGWRARVAADLGYNLDGERQLTLGADTGLRGYDPSTFDGTSRVVTNLEWRRRITGEILHVAALGLTAFADGGKTWGARVGLPTNGWRGDVGAGLLVEITRASVVRTLRLEVAYPDRGKGPVFQLTSDSLF
jgi:hypothetical protein